MGQFFFFVSVVDSHGQSIYAAYMDCWGPGGKGWSNAFGKRGLLYVQLKSVESVNMKGTPFFFLVASLVKTAFYASKYMYHTLLYTRMWCWA